MSGALSPSLSLSLFGSSGLSSGGVLEPEKREGERGGGTEECGGWGGGENVIDSPKYRSHYLLLQRSLAAVLTLSAQYEVAVLSCCGDSS